MYLKKLPFQKLLNLGLHPVKYAHLLLYRALDKSLKLPKAKAAPYNATATQKPETAVSTLRALAMDIVTSTSREGFYTYLQVFRKANPNSKKQ